MDMSFAFDGPEPLDRLAVHVGQTTWTRIADILSEAEPDSPAAALERYFAALPPQPPESTPAPVPVDNCTSFAVLLAEWEADPVMAAHLAEARRNLRRQLRADPNAKPALSGLTRTAYPARRGPGWCDE